MKSKLKGFRIFLAGLLFNLIESLWFGRNTELGFNQDPQSISEFVCDYIALSIMVFGIFLMAPANRRNDQ